MIPSVFMLHWRIIISIKLKRKELRKSQGNSILTSNKVLDLLEKDIRKLSKLAYVYGRRPTPPIILAKDMSRSSGTNVSKLPINYKIIFPDVFPCFLFSLMFPRNKQQQKRITSIFRKTIRCQYAELKLLFVCLQHTDIIFRSISFFIV